jgi:hypothetical protein
MSQTCAPIQIYNLFKSVMIIFLLQAVTVIVLLFSLIVEQRQIVGVPVLVINVIVSIVLGWRLYKSLYHMAFTYDDEGFTLKKGRKEVNNHKWNEFSKVSLIRTESGELSVRLYHDSEYFDLPASKLKMNPFTFRQEVTKLVSVSKGKK